MTETSEEPKKEKPSWIAILLDVVARHAREVVGGALAIAGTVEGDVRAFVMRFVRELMLGFVLLFIGFGFVVFGIGMTLVEVLNMGPAAGSVVVGTLFVATGAILLVFSRR